MQPSLPIATDRRAACERCFADGRLVAWIRARGRTGACGWCGAAGVRLVPLADLTGLFRPLADLYRRSRSRTAEPLAWLLQADWGIFSSRIAGREEWIVADSLLDGLLTAILRPDLDPERILAGETSLGTFRRPDHGPGRGGAWEPRLVRLLRALPADERAPGPTPDPPGDPREDPLPEPTRRLSAGDRLYRARLLPDRAPPPPERAGLQAASDERTALAEVRPWKGAVVAVTSLRLARPLRILDLCGLGRPGSPFFIPRIRQRLETHRLLVRLARELAHPSLPGEPDGWLRADPRLCDLARRAGLDGLAYPSPMGPGHDILLFDAAVAVEEAVTCREILGVHLDVAPLRWERAVPDP